MVPCQACPGSRQDLLVLWKWTQLSHSVSIPPLAMTTWKQVWRGTVWNIKRISRLCLSSPGLGHQDGVPFWLSVFTIPLYTAGAELLEMGLRKGERERWSGFLSTTLGEHLTPRVCGLLSPLRTVCKRVCILPSHKAGHSGESQGMWFIHCCTSVSWFLWVSEAPHSTKKGNFWFHPTSLPRVYGSALNLMANA